MPRGRPPLGVNHVNGLDGTRESKRRLRVILQTVTGELSVAEACSRLSVCTSRFHQMRRAALAGALVGLEPQSAGRPRSEPPDTTSRLAELEAENRELRIDLQAQRVRTEIALTMPTLLQGGKKKTRRRH